MRRAWPLAVAALIAGCGERRPAAGQGGTPGDRLEAAAMARGLVPDPARSDPAGLYARGDDRMCAVPGPAGAYRVGVLVRYDDAHGCVARGAASRAGDRLDIVLDGEPCRFTARFEGDRIVFPAELPAGCDRRCTGRASLAALTVDRLSDGTAEASAQRDGRDRPLCAT